METSLSKNPTNPLSLQLKDQPKPNSTTINPPHANPLLEFRSGITLKNKKISEKLEYKCGSETSLHSFHKQLQFQTKTPKEDIKILIPSHPQTSSHI
jgi:hypothetical protein